MLLSAGFKDSSDGLCTLRQGYGMYFGAIIEWPASGPAELTTYIRLLAEICWPCLALLCRHWIAARDGRRERIMRSDQGSGNESNRGKAIRLHTVVDIRLLDVLSGVPFFIF